MVKCGHYTTDLTIQAIEGLLQIPWKNNHPRHEVITQIYLHHCIYGLKIQSSCTLQTTNENLKPQKWMRVLLRISPRDLEQVLKLIMYEPQGRQISSSRTCLNDLMLIQGAFPSTLPINNCGRENQTSHRIHQILITECGLTKETEVMGQRTISLS